MSIYPAWMGFQSVGGYDQNLQGQSLFSRPVARKSMRLWDLKLVQMIICPRALLARLRAHLRKTPLSGANTSDQRISIGSLLIAAGCRAVELDGASIDLTTAEFDHLWLLSKNVGQVLSRNDIFQKLNGVKYDGFDRSIDLRISRLRKKLDDSPQNPQRIKSVRGIGYLLSVHQ